MDIKTSFSVSAKDLTEFKSLIEIKMADLGRPSLAILFVNADLDIDDIHQYLDAQHVPHIGTSSFGEFSNDQFHSGMYAGLFMYLPEDSFKIYRSDKDCELLCGRILGDFAMAQYDNPGIYMLIASKDTQTDLFIKDVQNTTDNAIPLYGGHAFDNLKFEKYTVFATDHITEKGVVAVVFDCDQIEIHGDAYSGWDSIGVVHTITKSVDNELLEIDGKPALDVFVNYFDYFDVAKAAIGEEEGFMIGNHPIKVIEENGASSIKSAIHLNLERKSLIYYCSVPVGSQFRFCTNPKLEITDNLIKRLEDLKSDISAVDCFLITSCASRYLTLGPFFKKEIKCIFQIWDKPMAGFLSGGEIGNIKESNVSVFHNVTCVFTGFKLKQ